ncbi:sugar transferase [Poseidonocella sp. HB161398]|uniref:sugar transferase n=1 Tax=Poseidonocella sp. HB161398 TaxID=2320855 RepID=UPI001F1152C2|nr:sugar transferase [Poseidonocella sp. HB161398]
MTIHIQTSASNSREVADHSLSVSLYRRSVKRVCDIAFVLCILPVIVPLILVFAAIVALDGSNPFFMQRRVGRDGRIFRLIKLRSMIPDAESRLLGYLAANPEAKREWDEMQKLSRDPRITPAGRFIRRFSIDELPQFFNVLAGHMSVVGPRPMLPSQRELYPGRAYYALRPGITGFWQVSKRNDASFAERAHFDADYFHAMSLRTDLLVMFRTVGAVLRATGA